MNSPELEAIIARAIKEDMPAGDITSESVIAPNAVSQAVILAKEEGIVAGIGVAEKVFHMIDPAIALVSYCKDGDMIKNGDQLARIQGKSISMLKGERTALNFLQRMSGIATQTRKYVEALQGTQTKLLDTRKTTPGLRALEKYAVRKGGGLNHRHNLSQMVMLKDNHLRLVGSISEAIKTARRSVGQGVNIEVETTTLEEVIEALQCGADMIMLDNMSFKMMREAVRTVQGRVPLEVSGNLDLEQMQKLASLGVDYVSVGRLTHSYKSLDISMKFL